MLTEAARNKTQTGGPKSPFIVKIDETNARISCNFHMSVGTLFSKKKGFFQLQNDFRKIFCGSFGIGLFVSSDTCKGKAAYIHIEKKPTSLILVSQCFRLPEEKPTGA